MTIHKKNHPLTTPKKLLGIAVMIAIFSTILFIVSDGDITGKTLSSSAVDYSTSYSYEYGAYTLTTAVNTSGGTITSAPAGISCTAGECASSYSTNTYVTLTATPLEGYTFEKWEGDCTGNTTTCTVTMDASKRVYAYFTAGCGAGYSIVGPTGGIEEQEASGAATPQITLIRPIGSTLKIQSVIATATPKNTPAINVAHPADGSGAGRPWMTWTQRSIDPSGLKAVLQSTDYAWYGTSGTNLCANQNDQSVYTISVQATLDNGCKLNTSIDMKVKFVDVLEEEEGGGNFMRPLPLLEGPKLGRVTKITTPLFKSMRNGATVYRACVSMDDLTIKSDGVAVSILEGQYKNLAKSEEEYHLKQTKGEKTWDDGGLVGIEKIATKYLSGQKICYESTSEQESRTKVANEFARVYGVIIQILTNPDITTSSLKDRGSIDIQKYIDYSKSAHCWVEKKAKDNIELTDNVGAFYLSCAYKSCNQSMTKPKSPVDMMNDNFTELHRAIYGN